MESKYGVIEQDLRYCQHHIVACIEFTRNQLGLRLETQDEPYSDVRGAWSELGKFGQGSWAYLPNVEDLRRLGRMIEDHGLKVVVR